MNKLEMIDFLQNKIREIEGLQPQDFDRKQQIEKNLLMFIRNVWGPDSEYLQMTKDAQFKFIPPSNSFSSNYDTQIVSVWNRGSRDWINTIHTMINEITIFSDDGLIKDKKNALSSRAFIVHGHNDEMLHATARLVSKLGLEPVILREQPNNGKTIIEKFEGYADVGFAIVLFSPDDVGKANNEKNLKSRPRQNVVFELGFFFGKLGRNHVAVLYKVAEDFEMLSDFNGILYVPYQSGWELQIARELKAAGFDIDLNKLVK